MEEKKLVPKRRFQGFKGEWEDKKLGELAEIVRGASPRPIEDPKWFNKTSTVGWLRISDVTTQNGRINHLEQRLSKLGQEKTRVLKEPHLLLSIAATVGKPVINYVETGVHDGFLIFLNPNFNIEYMYQWLEMFRKKWSRYGQPGSQINLNSNIIKEHTIKIPDIKEQEKIGKFFKLLDDRIANQEKKIAKVKALKEAYLNEMFPQEGERVPKRRFQGFEGEWEVINLCSLTNLYVGKSFSNNIKKNGKYIVMDMGSISSDGEKLIHKRTNLKRDILQKNDLVMPKDDIGGGNIIGKTAYIDANNKYVLGDHVFRLRFHEVEGMYMHYMINSPTINRRIKRKVSGSAQLGIGAKNVLSTYVYLPKSIKEQQKIGTFFKNLDEQIEAEEAKLEKLKKMKEAYLEEMFV